MKITAVIVAGGKGTRMGADKNKVFLKILGREVLYYTISAFEKNDKIDDIIVVTGKNDIEECQILVDKYDKKKGIIYNRRRCDTSGVCYERAEKSRR